MTTKSIGDATRKTAKMTRRMGAAAEKDFRTGEPWLSPRPRTVANRESKVSKKRASMLVCYVVLSEDLIAIDKSM